MVSAGERGKDEERIRMFIDFDGLVMDESAIHASWHCTGATGIKCCRVCTNVANPLWLAADEVGPDSWFVLYSRVFDEADCILQTKETIFAIVGSLKAAKPTLEVGAFKAKQMALGWTHHDHGLLVDLDAKDVMDPPNQPILTGRIRLCRERSLYKSHCWS